MGLDKAVAVSNSRGKPTDYRRVQEKFIQETIIQTPSFVIFEIIIMNCIKINKSLFRGILLSYLQIWIISNIHLQSYILSWPGVLDTA